MFTTKLNQIFGGNHVDVSDTAENIIDDSINEDSAAGGKLLGTFKCTAYCSCHICCHPYDPECTGKPSRTATGTTPRANHTIAVDPSVIPHGSRVKINGHVYTAEDTGGAIKSNRIDIYFDKHSDALAFGVRNYKVYLLDEG